jgi:hypothetical protein
MATHEHAAPADYSTESAIATEAVDTGKGALKGASSGLLGTALVTGLVVAALSGGVVFGVCSGWFGLSAVAASTWGMIAAGIFGTGAAAAGGMVGGGVGAAVGGLHGLRHGIREVEHGRALARGLDNQQIAAVGQVETARALQATAVAHALHEHNTARQQPALPAAHTPAQPAAEPRATHNMAVASSVVSTPRDYIGMAMNVPAAQLGAAG